MTASEPRLAGHLAAPAFLRVGGALVIRHQVALALGAGCRRIVIAARDFTPEFADLQRDAEAAGATFHVAPGPAGLAGLITASDDVLVMAEGLLPTPGDATPLIDGPQAVLVLPADSAAGAGFERIDLTYAWAGLMLLPGRLVDRLRDLSADVDPVSALLRIALQAGLALRNVPDAVRSGGRWLLIRSEADAQAAEEQWMARHTATGPRTPGPALTRLLVRRFGAAMLHEGNSHLAGLGLALLLAVLGLASGWIGYATFALLLAALAEVVLGTSLLLLGLQGGALRQGGQHRWLVITGGLGYDALLVLLLVFAMPVLPGQMWFERAFPPVVLIGLLRVLPPLIPGTWADWLKDRLVLPLVLALLAAAGVLAPAVLAMCVGLLVVAGTLSARRDAAGQAS